MSTGAEPGTGATPRLRIVFPHVRLSSFILQDLDTLRSCHEVRLVPCGSLWRMLRAMVVVPWADCVFCWFGSLRFLPMALVARLLGRPVLIVTGGYDVADLPDIKYGNMRRGPTRWLGRWLFRLADVAVTYSRSGAIEATANARVPAERQRLLFLGFDGNRVGGGPRPAKENFVLTVAGIDDSTIHRKGLLDVARTTRLLPDVRFVLAGRYEPRALARLQAEAGPNLECLGYVSEEELQDLYARARVYFQPSIHEAFGCSVAEAMLHDCIPVVTRRYSLPEVVGECGYYVNAGDPEGMATTLRAALAAPPAGVESPRARILREFPGSPRAEELLSIVRSLACSPDDR